MAKRFSWTAFWSWVAGVLATVATPLAILSHGGNVVRMFQPTPPPLSKEELFGFHYGPSPALWPRASGMLLRPGSEFYANASTCGRIEVTNPLRHDVTGIELTFPDDVRIDTSLGGESILNGAGPARTFKLDPLPAGKTLSIRYWMGRSWLVTDAIDLICSEGVLRLQPERAYTETEVAQFRDTYYVWLALTAVSTTLLIATWGWKFAPSVYVEDTPPQEPGKAGGRGKKPTSS